MSAAWWGYGIESHLIKQDCGGDADGVTLNLGSAVSGYRTFESLGWGMVFYWLEKGSDYEFGYASLDPTAHTLVRHSSLVVFCSSGSMLAMGGSDAGVVMQPPNPLSFGFRGAQAAPASSFSVPTGSMTRVDFAGTDRIFDSEDMAGTNEFVLPGWVQLIEVHARGSWAAGGGTRRAIQAVIGTSGGSGNIFRQVEQPGMTGGGSFSVNFGTIERYNDGSSTNTRLWLEAYQDSGSSLSLANYEFTVRLLP